jgi:hypothetical protein
MKCVEDVRHWVWGRVSVPCGYAHVYSIDYDSWPWFVFTYVLYWDWVFGEELGNGYGMWFKVCSKVSVLLMLGVCNFLLDSMWLWQFKCLVCLVQECYWCWYTTGTLFTCRPKPAEAFWHISVKYAECQCDNSSHMQSQRQSPLHSYTSNRSNTQRSWSVPLIIVFTLISYDTHLSLIIFKIIPHPMTLLAAIPLQVIIYILFNTAHFRSLTVTLLIRCPAVISRAFASILPFT